MQRYWYNYNGESVVVEVPEEVYLRMQNDPVYADAIMENFDTVHEEDIVMVKTECEMAAYDEIITNLSALDASGPEFYPFCPIKQELNATKILTYEEMNDPKLRHIINDHNYISSEDGYSRNVRQNLIDFVQANSESANIDVSETQVETLIDTVLGLLSKVTNLDLAIDKFRAVSDLNENKLLIKLDSDTSQIENLIAQPTTLDEIAQRLESDLEFDLNLLIKAEVDNATETNVDQIVECKIKTGDSDDNFSEFQEKLSHSEYKLLDSEYKQLSSECKSLDSECKLSDFQAEPPKLEDICPSKSKDKESEEETFNETAEQLSELNEQLDMILGNEDEPSPKKLEADCVHDKTSKIIISKVEYTYDPNFGAQQKELNKLPDESPDIDAAIAVDASETKSPEADKQTVEKLPSDAVNFVNEEHQEKTQDLSKESEDNKILDPKPKEGETAEANDEPEKPPDVSELKPSEEILSNDVDTLPMSAPVIIKELLKFANNLTKDCAEISSKADFNLENFLSLKLKEHKSIISSHLFKDSSIQTEKVISKKKLRKINAQDKRHLLESSNDSDSSNSSMDKTLNELEAEYKSRKPYFSKQLASSKESLASKKSFKDSQVFGSDCESDCMASQFNGSVGTLSKHESFGSDQSTDSEPVKKEKRKSTRALSRDSLSSTDKPNNKEDDKIENKSTNESDKENRISSVGSPGSCESKKSKDDESVDDNAQDKEIERLLNLKSLADPIKNIPTVNHTKQKSSSKLSSKTDNLYEVMREIDSISMSDDSMGEDSEQILTEMQFLVKCNENLKKQLLESASSDSENSNENEDIDLIKKINENSSDEDNPRESYVDKFLETLVDDEGSSPGDKEISKLETPIKTEIAKPSAEVIKTLDEISPTANSITSFRETFNSKQKENAQKCFETILAKDTRQRELKQQEDLIELSAESSISDVEECSAEPKDKNLRIKPMLRHDQLESETIFAQKKEADRLRRLEKRNNFLTKIIKSKGEEVSEKDLVLDYTSVNKRFIKVHADIVKHLKPHQRDGVKFMYDSTYGCVDSVKENSGSGCILAHCMGLGKTLQIIALLHTVTTYKELKTNKIMVLCPKSTIMNWADEIQRWLGPLDVKNLQIYNFSDTADIYDKINVLRQWSLSSKKAGCLIMGYEAFRSLVFYNTSKTRARSNMRVEDIRGNINKYLLKPGADLVVCDEGHIIKNRKSGISLAAAEIITPKRIILTGTPIQNNLKEYYAMVNFIKPLILGTEKEFANLYANPIKNGQHKDSSKRDIKVMKQRSFVLHKKLSKFVQRKEAELLQSFLPQKFEYCLFIPMTDVQNALYEYVLEAISKREDSRGKSLITDYTCLRKIWTHPKVLEDAWKNAITTKNKKDPPKRQTSHIAHSDDDQPDDIYDSQTGVISVQHDWWRHLVTESDLELILPSNKLKTMFEIIRMSEENGEKCLIFSAFVAVLNVVEYFFHKINDKQRELYMHNTDKPTGHWINGQDYYRLDGKTNKTLRHEMVKRFNDPKNKRTRVFLISAKAGGQGINLIGANRVIILDTSWNPANDQQNIFRIFRLGQKRNCYVYRLIAMGTMEEKVYSRSVTKQAMSFRVVDEQQIDRHYNMAELAELYTLTKPCYNERPVPVFPQDQILANLLLNFPDLVYKYHEHDSLLENKVEQELSEQDKADAWVAYERDLQINSEPREAMEGGFHGYPLFNQGNYMYPPMGDFDPKNYLPGNCDLNQMDIASRSALGSSLIPNYLASRNSYLDILNMYKNLSSTLLSDKGGRPPHYNPAYGMSLTSGMMNNTGLMPSNENHLSALANPYYPFPNSSLNPNAMLSSSSLSGSGQVGADRYDKNMITPDYPPSMRSDKNMITSDYPPSMRNDTNMITPDYPSSMRSSFPAPMPAPFTKDITGRSTQSKTLLQNSSAGASSSPNIRSSSSTRQTQQNMFNTINARDTIPSNVISKKAGKVMSKPSVISSPLGLVSATKNTQPIDSQLRPSSPRQTIVIDDSPVKQTTTTNSGLPVNMGIVYPKQVPLPLSPISDLVESGCVKKTGSSMQIIRTDSPMTDSVRKKFDNISPNISLTAVRSVPPKNSQSEKSSTISLLETSVTPSSRKRRGSFGTSSPGISSAEQPKKVSKY